LFWNELTIGTVRDQAGHITHFVGVQRDITEQKEASERLRLAYDDIARFSRDLERFAFVLAHHLQEPARLQGVFSEQLTRLLPHPLTEEQCECLGHIRRGARQLRTLLHDVENYISLNRGAVAGECSADAALDAALRFVSGRLDEVGATLHREPLQPVKLAQPRLTQVFRHMLDNAIEYREPDRPLRIAIRCTVAPSHITIHIADNGIGIDPDYLSRIFEVFERLHTHDEHDGTGMGLAVTHRIIELAGGRVWATSVPQEGTTLHVRLPRASGPAA
jgi:signal transduction histidine kinase